MRYLQCQENEGARTKYRHYGQHTGEVHPFIHEPLRYLTWSQLVGATFRSGYKNSRKNKPLKREIAIFLMSQAPNDTFGQPEESPRISPDPRSTVSRSLGTVPSQSSLISLRTHIHSL